MLRLRLITGAAMVLSCCTALTGQALTEPVRVGDELIFPDGAMIPRYLTETERAYIREFPLWEMTRATPPPTGPIRSVAEYEPMAGILIAWKSYTTLQRQMVQHITTTGDADVYIAVDSSSQQNTVTNTLIADGIDMNRIHFIVRSTNTVWIRDYGPRYIYEGSVRAIVDHTYNRPRPLDNVFNSHFGPWIGHEVYELPLVHGGGNYHLNALGSGHATRLIVNENPSIPEHQIIAYWQDYQNVLTTLWTPFPSNIDSTQHIDMWMQIIGDQNIIISYWPNNPGSTQAQICDSAAAHFTNLGWTVTRVPARHISWTHYTYTNMVVCNDLVLLPYYTNSSMLPHNAEALAAVQAAVPDKSVVQLNCEGIITAAGAMHCIVMHIPQAAGGEIPTVYIREPRGGDTYEPDEQVQIIWISDDDKGVTSIDLLLSTNGGITFPHTIAADLADTGSYLWTVPDIDTTEGRIRIIARDADGNWGTDEGDTDFTILGSQPDCPGDLNGDGLVDHQDLAILLSSYGIDDGGDLNGDGVTDHADLAILLSNYGNDCN